MSQTFFKREERKYLLTPEKAKLIQRKLASEMQPDKYFHTSIYNVYFDTEHDDLIIASLDSPNYKYKIRARRYDMTAGGKVFLEIKSKFAGVVYKRRLELTEQQYQQFLAGEHAAMTGQVAQELRYLFESMQLMPKIFIAYERYAYAAKDDSGLRVTLDTDLRSRTRDVTRSNCLGCEQYFDDEQSILEIKSRAGMPRWLIDFLNQEQMYPSSFSKYGKIYQRLKRPEVSYA